jgi:uncharacterized membrane protein
MFKLLRAFFHSRQLALIASLLFATLVCIGLLVLRVAYSHSYTYVWLLWNLFLAWLPALSALVAYNLYKRRSLLIWLIVPICVLVWFFFFPNAPYLVTDLVHLRPTPGAPFWYDLLLLVTFAWTGFFVGLISLVLMQEIVCNLVGTLVSWLFAVAVLALSSFGIYLGRFLRWNSWDVFFNPLRMLVEILQGMRHPFAHAQTVVFSVLMACFLVAMYLTLTALMHFRPEVREG